MLIGTKQTDGGSLRVATPESKIAVTSKDSVIRETSVAAYTVPTDFPESDGTIEWDKTTLVLVNASAGDKVGIGYTYAGLATAQLISGTLLPVIHGMDAMNVPACWSAMRHAIRNLGRSGTSLAIPQALGYLTVDTAIRRSIEM
jgi:hypothetical protein